MSIYMSRTYHHNKSRCRGLKADLWRDGGWLRAEPKEWRRLQKHRKRRAECRACVSRVMSGEEEVLFPLDTKPWVYYW